MRPHLRRTIVLLTLAALAGCSDASSANTPGLSPTPGTPSVAKHTLYLLSSDLLAVQDGRLLWQFHVPLAPTSSALTVDSGVVYLGDADTLFALDAVTGRQLWSVAANPGIQSINIVGDVVYVGSGSSIYAFSKQDGGLLWHQDTSAYGGTTQVLIDQGTVYGGGTTGTIALDATTGSIRWRFDTHFEQVQALLPAGQILLVKPLAGGVIALQESDGHQRWHQDNHILALQVFNDIVYSIFSNALPQQGGLRAQRISDGSILWQMATPVSLGEQDRITAQAFYRASGPGPSDLSAWSTALAGPWRRQHLSAPGR